jgi:hypothetical protein
MRKDVRSTGPFLVTFKVASYFIGAVSSILALLDLEVWWSMFA